MAEDINQNTADNPMGEGGFVSPFEQLSINLDNYFNSDDFREGIQPGNLNPFSQAPSGSALSGDASSGSGNPFGGNPFGGNPFEFNPLGGEEQSEEDSDSQGNPMMGSYRFYRNDSNSTDESMVINENPFSDIDIVIDTDTDTDTDTDNLFAAEIDNLSESFSNSLESGQARYQSFSEAFNNLETGTDTEGDELAPFTNFLNTLSESDIELPSGSPINNLDEFSDLASSFSELAASNAETFIEAFSDVDFTGGSGNPFSDGNPFLSDDNPLTEILVTVDSSVN